LSSPTRLRYLAAALAALVGVLHLVMAPEYLEEAAYIGVLFIVGGLALLGVAAALVRRPAPAAWTVGGLISIGMFVGFVASRTVGLPGFHESEWELSGIVSLVLEAAFVTVWAIAHRHPELSTTPVYAMDAPARDRVGV
jgi:uncharacterized membrane protein YhaH (DUF805 family)